MPARASKNIVHSILMGDPGVTTDPYLNMRKLPSVDSETRNKNQYVQIQKVSSNKPDLLSQTYDLLVSFFETGQLPVAIAVINTLIALIQALNCVNPQ